jgi:hypothetical protein
MHDGCTTWRTIGLGTVIDGWGRGLVRRSSKEEPDLPRGQAVPGASDDDRWIRRTRHDCRMTLVVAHGRGGHLARFHPGQAVRSWMKNDGVRRFLSFIENLHITLILCCFQCDFRGPKRYTSSMPQSPGIKAGIKPDC